MLHEHAQDIAGETTKRVMQAFTGDHRGHYQGIARYARQAGWSLSRLRLRREDPATALNDWDGDGVLCQLRHSAPDLIKAVCALDMPKVDLAGRTPELGLASVIPDSITLGNRVARHFLDNGFEHFLFVGRPPSRGPYTPAVGFEAMVAEAGYETKHLYVGINVDETIGLRLDDDHWVADESSARIRQWLAGEIVKLPQPLAIFVDSLPLAVDTLDACREKRLLVPEQVSVVTRSIDPIESEFTTPPLSTIGPNFEEQGYRAAQLLDMQMNGQAPDTTPILVPPTEVIVRESSAMRAVDHIEAARALRFILKNYSRRNLSAEDVVKATSVSRRRLYYAFEEFIGRPIAAEIDRARSEHAMGLLRETNQKISDIAEQCGYSNLRHMGRSLQRIVGKSPREYRRSQKV